MFWYHSGVDPVTRVTKNGQTYALFIPAPTDADGVRFVTEDRDEFQVGVMRRPAGHLVKPHTHPRKAKTVEGISEFLLIRSGKVKITVFDEEWMQLDQRVLSGGDCLVFFRGGHSLEMLEETRLIEVKQGPYEGDAASKTFRADSKDRKDEKE